VPSSPFRRCRTKNISFHAGRSPIPTELIRRKIPEVFVSKLFFLILWIVKLQVIGTAKHSACVGYSGSATETLEWLSLSVTSMKTVLPAAFARTILFQKRDSTLCWLNAGFRPTCKEDTRRTAEVHRHRMRSSYSAQCRLLKVSATSPSHSSAAKPIPHCSMHTIRF
jgi:hypothetical protein